MDTPVPANDALKSVGTRISKLPRLEEVERQKASLHRFRYGDKRAWEGHRSEAPCHSPCDELPQPPPKASRAYEAGAKSTFLLKFPVRSCRVMRYIR